jgi:hypothetical protein
LGWHAFNGAIVTDSEEESLTQRGRARREEKANARGGAVVDAWTLGERKVVSLLDADGAEFLFGEDLNVR